MPIQNEIRSAARHFAAPMHAVVSATRGSAARMTRALQGASSELPFCQSVRQSPNKAHHSDALPLRGRVPSLASSLGAGVRRRYVSENGL